MTTWGMRRVRESFGSEELSSMSELLDFLSLREHHATAHACEGKVLGCFLISGESRHAVLVEQNANKQGRWGAALNQMFSEGLFCEA